MISMSFLIPHNGDSLRANVPHSSRRYINSKSVIVSVSASPSDHVHFTYGRLPSAKVTLWTFIRKMPRSNRSRVIDKRHGYVSCFFSGPPSKFWNTALVRQQPLLSESSQFIHQELSSELTPYNPLPPTAIFFCVCFKDDINQSLRNFCGCGSNKEKI